MSLPDQIPSERQLVRLLQTGIVLEEIVEVRSAKHYETATARWDIIDENHKELFEEAQEESAEHRARLETLIERLDAETVPFKRIEQLVASKYERTKPQEFHNILYDQLHGEKTAYKFYDNLINAIKNSNTAFSVDRDELFATLREIRKEEAEGVKEVMELIEAMNENG